MAEILEYTDRSHYEADLEKAKALAGPEWLKDLREAGASRFAELSFPHYKQEAWRFTDVSPIVKTPFVSLPSEQASVSEADVAPHLYEEPEWLQIVFVDGAYTPNLSKKGNQPEGVLVAGLAETIASGDDALKAHLGGYLDESNAFIALNSAFMRDGAFVHISKGTCSEIPIHLVFVATGTANLASYPRNLIVVGESAEAVLIETYIGLNDEVAYLTNSVTEIFLENNATLRRHKVVLEGAAGYHLSTTKIVQGRDTNLTSFDMSLTGKIVRNELDVVLNGEGGNAHLNGLYLNDRDRLIDNALHVTHATPRCYSRMRYKGVLDDTSSSVFTGKVLVLKDSQRTDSDQLNNNLLLSDKAVIDTQPQLEIFADDVKCTHGATIGGFPWESIFYFQSRGMAEDMAHAILTFGFASEVVDRIEIEALRDRLSHYVFDKYSPK